MKKNLLIIIALFQYLVLLAQNEHFKKYKLSELQPGMTFRVMPLFNQEVSDYETVEIAPYKSKDYGENLIKLKSYIGKDFKYAGTERRKYKCPRGTCEREYLIFDSDGKKFEHEFRYLGVPYDTVDLPIKGLVFLNDFAEAQNLIRNGWVMYTKRVPWNNYPDTGYYYAKVKIVNIELVPSMFAPYRLHFESENGKKSYFDVSLSGTNLMGRDSEGLYQYFSDTDPKLNYTNISNEDWRLIQLGVLKIGWSKEKCELSWGKPKKINRTTTANSISEQWVYGNSYLYFDNGILKTIQN